MVYTDSLEISEYLHYVNLYAIQLIYMLYSFAYILYTLRTLCMLMFQYLPLLRTWCILPWSYQKTCMGKMIYVKSYTALYFREYEIAKFPDTYSMDFYGVFIIHLYLNYPKCRICKPGGPLAVTSGVITSTISK